MKFYLRKIILVLFLMLSFTGCYSKKNRQLMKQYENQAKKNALSYIQEKYGLKAKIISADASVTIGSPIPNVIVDENVWVLLKANNKKFYVYITGKEQSTNGIDNYQKEKIEEDLIHVIKQNISIPLYDYKIWYPKYGYINKNEQNGCIKEYYNGNNLEEVIHDISLELNYVGDNDFSKLDISHLKSVSNLEKVSFINYRNEVDLFQYRKAKVENCDYKCEELKNIYKDNEIILENEKIEYYNYNASNFHDELLIYSSENQDNLITTTKLDINDIKKEFNLTNIEQVSGAYSISSNKNVAAYFSKSNVKTKKNKNLIFVTHCLLNGKQKYQIHHNVTMELETVGNYYVERIYPNCDRESMLSFALFKVIK